MPNLASQMRVAFASMASKTGSSSPGELEMTRSTSEVAVCCSSASASFFFRSALAARRRSTCSFAFVPVERRPANAGLALRPLARQGHLVGTVTGPFRSEVPQPQGSSPSILTEPHDELARPHHSITSSARASSVGGISRPSALAVFRLIISSYLVGSWTGRSAGCTPLNILSTYRAALRYVSAIFVP